MGVGAKERTRASQSHPGGYPTRPNGHRVTDPQLPDVLYGERFIYSLMNKVVIYVSWKSECLHLPT